MKKKLAVLIALVMALAVVLSACGGGETSPTPKTSGNVSGNPSSGPDTTTGQAKIDSAGNRVIRIGTWYEKHYESKDTGPEAAAKTYPTSPEASQAQFDHMRAVETELKVKFEYVRMTYDGIQVSIEEGAISGKPEVDIYESEGSFGLPAALSGYATNLRDVVDADNDLFNKQQVFTPVAVPSKNLDEEVYLFWNYNPGYEDAYYLAFNLTLLESKGLPNPQDLWTNDPATNQWTWDKFKEYLTAITNINATPAVYGFAGYPTNHLDGFLRSNGTDIAATETEHITTAATGEVGDLFKRIYSEKLAKPWDSDNWESNNDYVGGNIGFFTGASWILEQNGGGTNPNIDPLGFDIGIVPYPVGPSGDAGKNAQRVSRNKAYFIPKGVDNAKAVYDAFFALNNWYDGDYKNTEQYDVDLDENSNPLPPAPHWFAQQLIAAARDNQKLADKNIEIADYIETKQSVDLWNQLGITDDLGVAGLITADPDASIEVSAWQQENKQILQDKLDNFFKK